ncbi:hypothetical protein [Echinicola rosea]|uniref:Lipocalin-like domain-containing protein n=1 Tax=Echinicola rosea TaxID=1807691 RepID=A0ABQ1V7W7_9BACT|nr:hypothetical protein [Echinicola rosea]GGF42895.1 hypothetical protein GCM10011339_34220 [Echinicola rosea]
MSRLYLWVMCVAIALAGCGDVSPDIDPDEYVYGEWILSRTFSPEAGVSKAGDELLWEERYVFYRDSTFERMMSSAAGDLLAKGNFTMDHRFDSEYLAHFQLQYTSGDVSLRSRCGANNQLNTEMVMMDYRGRLINRTDAPCDGWVLYFEK